jgi:hypothetical protein
MLSTFALNLNLRHNFLMDHNVPATKFRSLLAKVTRVIDHHEDEAMYPPDAATDIALVGLGLTVCS